MTVRMGKGEKTRVLPSIDEETLNDLRHLIGDRQTGPVLLSGGFGPTPQKGIFQAIQLGLVRLGPGLTPGQSHPC